MACASSRCEVAPPTDRIRATDYQPEPSTITGDAWVLTRALVCSNSDGALIAIDISLNCTGYHSGRKLIFAEAGKKNISSTELCVYT